VRLQPGPLGLELREVEPDLERDVPAGDMSEQSQLALRQLLQPHGPPGRPVFGWWWNETERACHRAWEGITHH
jgi:hypothetical protein